MQRKQRKCWKHVVSTAFQNSLSKPSLRISETQTASIGKPSEKQSPNTSTWPTLRKWWVKTSYSRTILDTVIILPSLPLWLSETFLKILTGNFSLILGTLHTLLTKLKFHKADSSLSLTIRPSLSNSQAFKSVMPPSSMRPVPVLRLFTWPTIFMKETGQSSLLMKMFSLQPKQLSKPKPKTSIFKLSKENTNNFSKNMTLPNSLASWFKLQMLMEHFMTLLKPSISWTVQK